MIRLETEGVGRVKLKLRSIAEPRRITKMLMDIASTVNRNVIERHRTETDAWGRPLKPLSPITIARKGHDRILFETGTMRQRHFWRMLSPTSVRLWPGVRYAGYHQFGIGVPRRPIYPMDEGGQVRFSRRERDQIERIVAHWLNPEDGGTP